MIPFSFEYYKPENSVEAYNLYNTLSSENKKVYYYSGGTEIITMSRTFSIKPDSVIDIKGILDTLEMKQENDKLIIGSNVTLSRISESKIFPLLSTTVARIADHTNQNRITLGGNICGTIIYKEAILPLLLTDANVVILSGGSKKELPINSIFNKRLNILDSDLVLKFIIESKYINLPYFHIKKTQSEKIDYPLLTVCALKYDGKIRIAFSGLGGYPFRSYTAENIINDNTLTNEDKANQIFINLFSYASDSIEGSKDYKMFVLKNTILDILNLKELENGSI